MIWKKTAIVLGAFVFAAFGRDTLVSASAPYSSGIVRLGADSDTVTFSNGVKIFSLQFVPEKRIPEGATVNGAVAMRFPGGKAAYRKPQSLPATGAPNPDTVWASANGVPASSYPPDSLFLGDSVTGKVKSDVKILYTQYYSDQWYCGEISPYNDYRSILYFIPLADKIPGMKLQVAAIVVDSVNKSSPSGICRDPKVSGLTLRWANDSLGNGRFQPSSGVRSARQSSVRNAAGGACRIINLDNAHCMQAKGNGLSVKGMTRSVSLKGACDKHKAGKGLYIVY
jgi:hypothetical protein